MCASMKPGTTYLPAASTISRAVVVAEPGDPAVDDRDVRLEPLAREHREHAPAADDDVGGLVAARDGEAPREDASMLRRTVPFAPVDVLTPRTLDEALRLKAERPDAGRSRAAPT